MPEVSATPSVAPVEMMQGKDRVIVNREGESVVMYKVGGKTYPMKHVRGCLTCESPLRSQIENALIAGYSYQRIEELLPDEAKTNRRSIGRHFDRGHMPIDETHRRMLIEEQAKELGYDPETHESMLANHVTFARLGVTQVLQEMAEGKLKPDIKDGIKMAEFLQKVEAQAGSGVDAEALKDLIQVFFDAVMAEVGTDKIEAIARRAENDDRMAGIRKQLLAATQQEE